MQLLPIMTFFDPPAWLRKYTANRACDKSQMFAKGSISHAIMLALFQVETTAHSLLKQCTFYYINAYLPIMLLDDSDIFR